MHRPIGSIFGQQSGNIECTIANITGARCYSSNSLQGGLEVPCTLRFSWWSIKLGRSFKLSASKNINEY